MESSPSTVAAVDGCIGGGPKPLKAFRSPLVVVVRVRGMKFSHQVFLLLSGLQYPRFDFL